MGIQRKERSPPAGCLEVTLWSWYLSWALKDRHDVNSRDWRKDILGEGNNKSSWRWGNAIKEQRVV